MAYGDWLFRGYAEEQKAKNDESKEHTKAHISHTDPYFRSSTAAAFLHTQVCNELLDPQGGSKNEADITNGTAIC
jgi:hypothetical protein